MNCFKLGAKLALIALSGLALAACDKSKAVDPPAKLVDIKPVLQIKKLWSTVTRQTGITNC